MKNKTKRATLICCSLVLFSSCIDKNYDLSDIDGTARFKVNDFALPIKIDEITLGNIIDLNSDVIQVVDNQYVIIKDGIVNTEEINIPRIYVKAPYIKPDDTVIRTELPFARSSNTTTLPNFELKYKIASTPSDCSYTTNDVSDYIVDVENCKCKAELDITISLLEAEKFIKGAKFSDIVFKLPRGLVLSENAGGTYDMNSGELKFDEQYITGSEYTIHLKASAIDFTKTNFKYDHATHSMTFSEQVCLTSGWVTITNDDILSISNIPSALTLRTTYKLSDIEVTNFTGTIKYDVGEVDIPEINLGDIPEVFMQEGTDIAINNPCIYLQFNNPLQKYSLTARTGLLLTAFRANEPNKTFTLDESNPYITINTDKANSIYNFCLSPNEPDKYDDKFTGAEHIGFMSLSYLLSGNGLPNQIGVKLIDPCVPQQRVVDFPLGLNLGKINGTYKLLAPLDFIPGSKIVYADKTTGWGDKDIQKIVIEKLEVTLKVSTNIPIAIDFVGYPLDIQGKRINNVEITGAKIDANAKDQLVTLRITGTISDLDGLEYRAIATSTDSGSALSPSMSVKLSEIKPVVSGYYEDEL